ncbi:low affinity immunoglobulin gamma Fc region receptor II-a-like [Trachinotus anak]|uniref:low affinity immunoglobulin gamma Fc region receptor II-a-like n=1 Tax=Trachinotus anak TaxID=443729 RepID=UPI0039F19538
MGSDADVRIVMQTSVSSHPDMLFEYESVSFTCRGFNLSAGWSVRNIKEVIPTCLTSVTCTLNYAFVSDSGEYWCEGAGGERSSTVNITVTGGSVILESPVLPVMEGEAVTLRCRNRATSSNLTADFYKDGLFIGSSSTGNMTIASVSKFDGGLYTCSISGAGESPASRLTVRAAHREACPLSDHSHVLVLGRTVLTVVMVALLLLLLGLLHCGKLGGTHKKKPSTY